METNNEPVLTPQQEKALILIHEKKNLFITGMGGTGKSFLINLAKTDNTTVTALTGSAATLIGGCTLHAWSGLPINPTPREKMLSKVQQDKVLRGNWLNTERLIIDEVSMMTPEMLNRLNFLGQRIRQNVEFFGGIQVIFTGDFAQLAPPKCNEYLFECKTWKENIEHIVYLTVIHRQTDQVFQKLLNEVRLGRMSPTSRQLLKSRTIDDSPDIPDATMLFPHNKNVREINERELNKLLQNHESRVFQAEDEIIRSDTPSHISKSLISILNDGIPREITLAVGTKVILTQNIEVSQGLCNGSRGTVRSFDSQGDPVVHFTSSNMILPISRRSITAQLSKWTAKRQQIPLKLGWAISIHGAQGMTLDNVVTDLRDCFAAGQAYVTLSRIRTLDGLHLKGISAKSIYCHPKVIRYYQSLSNNTD